MSVTVTSCLVCRSQCFHRCWLRGPGGRLWFQCGFAGPFQVSSGGFRKQDAVLEIYSTMESCMLSIFWKLLRCTVYFRICADCLSLPPCRWVKQENEISKCAQLGDSGPKLDLGFKEGQTITLNIGVKTSLTNIKMSKFDSIFKTFKTKWDCWRV